MRASFWLRISIVPPTLGSCDFLATEDAMLDWGLNSVDWDKRIQFAFSSWLQIFALALAMSY